MSALVISGDTSGAITLQSPAVAGTNTVNFGANTGTAILDANTPAFRNRIINGAMVIDQRNAGASVSITPSTAYPVDRFSAGIAQGSGHTAQRSPSAPTGFINSLLVTVGTGASASAGSVSRVFQNIEGLNIADLDWGLATASTITLSFWVKSSLTGTFAGGIYNSATNRTYVFTYTISAANTWEQKSVTIAGDTSGTWLTTNGIGMTVNWDLGTGSTYQGTAGVWAAGAAWATSGSVKLAATSGANWSVTGVQLEKGSTATSFDYRPYTTELQLCQRYLPAWNTQYTNEPFGTGVTYSTTAAHIFLTYQVQPRVSPTGITASAASSFYLLNATNGVAGSYASTTFYKASLNGLDIISTTSAGLVAGNGTFLATNSGPAQILATGCEL